MSSSSNSTSTFKPTTTTNAPRRPPPKLSLSTLTNKIPLSQQPSTRPRRLYPKKIIDSHVHLWTQSQIEENHITWPTELEEGHPLKNGSHSLEEEYSQLVLKGVELLSRDVAGGGGGNQIEMGGLIYVQAEFVHDDQVEDNETGGWKSCLVEIEQVCQASKRSKVKVLALCPWAPIHLGISALSNYLPLITSIISKYPETKISSFRYLLQDAPQGFYISTSFIEGLNYLGELGYAFDLTVDSRRGSWMLGDCVELITRLRKLESAVSPTTPTTTTTNKRTMPIVIDHFGKPDLKLGSNSVSQLKPGGTSPFNDWLESIYQLALLPRVYFKLSGLLDLCSPEVVRSAANYYHQLQLDKEPPRKAATPYSATKLIQKELTVGKEAYKTLKEQFKKVVEPVLEAFGEERILIGSDWPMFRACTIKTGTSSPLTSPAGRVEKKDLLEESSSWAFEMKLYLEVLIGLGLSDEALDRIFYGTAEEVYQLS